MAERGELAHLTKATRRLALARFELLRPHLENGVSLSRLARQHSVPLRTLERWLRKYRQDGLGGLVRKPYANRGRRRLPTELQHLIERTRPSATAVEQRRRASRGECRRTSTRLARAEL